MSNWSDSDIHEKIEEQRQKELRSELWEKLKEASEIASDAQFLRINEGIQLLLEVISSRAKEDKRYE